MTTAITSVQRRRPADLIAARLSDDIRSGRLSAGSHMTAQGIADQFAVSRSPANEALRRMAGSGLLRHEPNRGFFVVSDLPPPSQDDHDIPDPLEAVYYRIAEDRLSGALPQQVSQGHLRQRYGLTAGQLNELLTRIVKEGWIERRPGYGLAFSDILTTPDALVQTYRLRLALEPAALLEPGYKLDRTAAEECRRVETFMLEGGIVSMTPDELYDRGVRFHEVIVSGSQNPFYLDALKRINSIRRLLAYRSMGNRDRYIGQAEDHLAILSFLEQDRNEEAAWALRSHLGKVIHNLTAIRPMLEGAEPGA